jgi:dipeptidyl aminopeptidase/acylaminoacyl peptidase
MIASLLSAAIALAAPAPSAAPASAAPAAPTAPRPLTLEALRQSVAVRTPAISPDGKRVVYVRGTGDYKADVEKIELVLVDAWSGARRVLTQDRSEISAPAWSPDGTRVAFLTAPAKDEMPEIYVLALDGGDAQRITHARGMIGGFAWRPDGRGFAYTLRDPVSGANTAPGAPSPAPTPSASPTPKGYVEAFTVTDEHYLTRTPSRPSHLWTIEADGTNPRQITRGAASDSGRIDWLPSGSAVVVTEQPDAVFAHFTKAHAVVVDIASGSVRPLRAGTVDSGAVLAPDGTRVVVRVPRRGNVYLHNDVAVRRVSDGADVATSVALDRNARYWDWLDDGNVLVGAAEGVRSYLWRMPAAGGAAVRYDLGEVEFGNDATVARDGTIAFVGHNSDRPGEIYVLRRGAKPVAVSDENAWARGYAIGRSERVDWTSDGMNVNGVLTYPPNYVAGKQYPLVLLIHGGPIATSTRDFSSLAQMLAAHGNLVLQPNYRGSDNSGDAFLQAIVGPVTSGPGRDNLAGVEAVKKMGIVDPARIGVSGWSGGGLQTSWLIGHATFWRAALSGAAVNDWFEQATLADINEEFASTFLGGATPWTAEGRAKYRDESPITYAKNVKTPTLILTDSSDQRVPISQSFAFYRALQGRGVTVRMMEFPRAGHNPTDPVAREARIRIWTEWFDRWMK